ncbi:DUF554 domain-containing protein [Vagococcus sp. DIV0080]|uniref:DUF554 domain-containing protein n=1 Tax=Candidatus Vagococcus giribetii TaxID=2230876 RepID=A0ABS3HQX8_9ENTE|nr:DUF554 domain-containing protein [Vagococcus sp. DIV0080]MBO0476153.1 DUF554 domain-containing protein [Vagococcus sp. DIV0080]
MPVGPFINCLSTLLGALIGAFLGKKIPERLRLNLPLTFGAASMGMGISMVVKVHMLPPVILSLLLGSAIGELLKLEKGIEWCAQKVRGPIQKIFPSDNSIVGSQENFMQQFVGIVVLFSASGTGIFGALNEGITGDPSILISKSFLDFFTAAIFATALGYIVTTTVIPQFVILFGLFFLAGIIMPLTTPEMIADFSACGGIIMFVTGLRISGIKAFPIANMLPALLIVMFISNYWTAFFG